MLKFRFESIEDFNNFYNQRISSNDRLFKLDVNAFVLLNTKNYAAMREVIYQNLSTSELRQTALSETVSHLIDNYNDSGNTSAISEIHILQESFAASEYAAVDHYIYPFSKTLFLSSFFSDFMPSFASDFYSYSTTKLGIFKQIGSGQGQSIVIKNYTISSQPILDNINLSCSIISQIDSVSETISKVDSIILKQNLDIQFMNTYISELEDLVADLKNQLDTERKQGVNGYYRTWH